MQTAEVINLNGTQVVKIPEEFRFDSETVLIRREGKAVILEPVTSLVPSSTWPKDFFESIRIDDPAFARPDQGVTPPAPSLD
jgi:virulence-associated protein VagC